MTFDRVIWVLGSLCTTWVHSYAFSAALHPLRVLLCKSLGRLERCESGTSCIDDTGGSERCIRVVLCLVSVPHFLGVEGVECQKNFENVGDRI